MNEFIDWWLCGFGWLDFMRRESKELSVWGKSYFNAALQPNFWLAANYHFFVFVIFNIYTYIHILIWRFIIHRVIFGRAPPASKRWTYLAIAALYIWNKRLLQHFQLKNSDCYSPGSDQIQLTTLSLRLTFLWLANKHLFEHKLKCPCKTPVIARRVYGLQHLIICSNKEW